MIEKNVFHTIVSLTGFFRRDSNTEPDYKMYKYLLETSRLEIVF